MFDAIDRIRTWPVARVAAGVRTPDGLVTVSGEHDRPFALASVTKLLTAAAVLVAHEEGSIALDEVVSTPAGATMRHLLAHASGLAFDSDAIVSQPGRRRIYSNRGYEVLAAHVEARTGITFAEYLSEGVLQPLAMHDTRLTGSAGAESVSTVDDLLRFFGGMHQVLSPDTIAAATSVQFPDLEGVVPGFGIQRPNPWGLGPEIRGAKTPHWTGARNSSRTWGHFGRAGTFAWVDPTAGVTLVVLTDREFGDWAKTLWPQLSDAVLAGAVGVE